MKNKLILIFGVFTFLFFESCAKEGPMGPAGKDGINGIDGVNGQDGINGKDGVDGKDGNANIISISSSKVTFAYNSTVNAFRSIVTIPQITQDIVDGGVVLCYEKVASGQWMPWNANVGTTYYIFNFRLGEVVLEYRNTAGTTTDEGTKEMRFVIIPPSRVSDYSIFEVTPK